MATVLSSACINKEYSDEVLLLRCRIPFVFFAYVFAAGAGASELSPEALQFFETAIRPILADNCYSCHSVKAEKLKGKLYLDSREGVARGGAGGAVIVPGDPEKSRLIQAVKYKLKDQDMPPDGPLAAKEIAALEQWVKMGAPDPRTSTMTLPALNERVIDWEKGRQFWSFQPLKETPPPKVNNSAWCRNDIDRFVLARLEAKKIEPNPTIDKRRLIRRVYFDLTGLPPEPAQIDAFLADTAPDAYEKLLDSLLASPHYGERWGRHWLDLARFAESHGFEHDYDRKYAYHYRDFVIQAFNQDLPYDTFVKWQLAGDEFAPDNILAMKATGYLAAGVHATQITANQAEKERYDELDDMVQTLGTSMLGLTFGCARCHDHKFDPIRSRDYYRLLAVFTRTVRSEVELDADYENTLKAKLAFEAEHKPYAAALAAYEHTLLPNALAAWETRGDAQRLSTQPHWETVDIIEAKSNGGAVLKTLEDGSILASGPNPKFDSYSITAKTQLKGITGIRLEALAHPSFVKGGPGRAGNGNFALTNFKVEAAPLDKKRPGTLVELSNPRADFEQKNLPIAAAIDSDPKSGWAIDPQFGKDHRASFETKRDLGFDGGTALTFKLYFDNNEGHSIGRLRLSVTAMPRPVNLEADGLSGAVQAVLAVPAEQRTTPQKELLFDWYKRQDPEWLHLKKAADDHLAKAPKGKLEMVQISSEGTPAVRLHTQGPDFYEKSYVLKRGDLNQKLEEAQPGYPAILVRADAAETRWTEKPPLWRKTTYARRSLANWITDTRDGAGQLLARVIVNRLWQHHFGRGIVTTPSDFGAQGTRPSDPELLDYLARQLIAGGWKLKPLHKLILTSAAYLQDSRFDHLKAAADPEEQTFWRCRSGRLEAEAIRDSMLAVSGQLDPRMFGSGTLDAASHRRSVYLTVKRSQLIPMLTAFDWPSATQSTGLRPATTVAPQALELLNNPVVRDCAKAFARRVAPDASVTDEVAVTRAYLIALGRPPTDREQADSVEFLAALGKAAGREKALADFCQALMGLNEFMYVE